MAKEKDFISCSGCLYGVVDDCNPNNVVCECTKLVGGKPNPHFKHILHHSHLCEQYTPEPRTREIPHPWGSIPKAKGKAALRPCEQCKANEHITFSRRYSESHLEIRVWIYCAQCTSTPLYHYQSKSEAMKAWGFESENE